MPIEYLDGRRFRRFVVSGADWVRHTREHLNRINVFPVPDGDTGTNMALSLAATASTLRATEERALGPVTQRAAEASILGAKGNSGVIMAHWFLGFSKSIESRSRAGSDEVAHALSAAAISVYAAIDNPVEGTIVSVMKAVGERAARAADERCHDLGVLMNAVVESAEAALARTPDQLPVLREANVVDAGAQGYVNFLHGAVRAVRGEPPPALTAADLDRVVDHTAFDHDPGTIAERFCTEVVVRGRGFEGERLKRRFRRLGTSLLVATTGEVFKLHIHTNHPDEVMRVAGRLGAIEERKVDDMRRQHEDRAGSTLQPPLVALESQPASVAIVCDSTADLPMDARREHGIEMAPLQVLFGDEVFRDQVDLDTEGFYARLQEGRHHPTTSQPPPREFVEALERVRTDRDVVIVTISAGLSGTYKSARNGAALCPHPRIEVFDSGSASMGLGMMALNAARLAARGAGIESVLEWLGRWRDDTGLVFSLDTLEYLRRGGRIGAAKSLLGTVLGLKPILTFADGRIVPLDRARGPEETFEKVAHQMDARLEPGARVRLGLIEIGPSVLLDRVEARIRRRCEVLECVRGAPTGVVGAHAGPGAWGVFYQRVRDDDPLLG